MLGLVSLSAAPATTLHQCSQWPSPPHQPNPTAMGKREKARLAKLEAERAAAKASKPGGPAPGATDETGFQRLTELADMLVSAGELDVYTATCEQLRRWAALTLPQSEVEGGEGKAGGGGAGKAAAGDDDDDDMFASDDEENKPAAKPAAAAAAAGAAAPVAAAPPAATEAALPAAGAAAAPAAAAGGTGADAYASWPIKELRRFLQERGQVSFFWGGGGGGTHPHAPTHTHPPHCLTVDAMQPPPPPNLGLQDTAGIVEKEDLVAQVREVAARGPARTT